MKEKVLITSALLYANGQLHFGHAAGAYLPADTYARFKRLKGNDVLFISGSDEYGVAITLSAELAGRTPKEQVDHFHKINHDLFKKLQISFDHYSRTTCKQHAPIVQDFFLTLLKNNAIEERVTKQLYSEEEKRFLADRYVIGTCPKCGYEKARGDECTKCGASYEATDLVHPKSKLTGSKLTLKETKHWFLKLENYKENLLKWLDTRDWKPNVTNFIRPYIEDVHARAITRDAEWGVPIPLPGTEGKVLYVWFDAPIGYISATQEWAEGINDKEAWKSYWLDSTTKYVQFIGKDNITFHGMFFPAMCMGQDAKYKLVDYLPANEFLNLEGKQFSKSDGWYIDLADFLEKFPSDYLRYTLSANAPENQDADFSFSDFQMRVNTELVGKFGNFIHRTLTFIVNRMEGKIPECHAYDEIDNEFLEEISGKVKEIGGCYEEFRVRKATTLVMMLADKANAYFDHKKPWVLLKNKEESEKLNTSMYCCLTAIKALALTSFPIIPESANKIWAMLGFSSALDVQNWDDVMNEDLTPGVNLMHPKPLFQKVEDEIIEKETALLKKDKDPKINFEEFLKVDLRIAKIISVEKVPKSKKLYKLRVTLGDHERTIVSGIAEFYPNLEELIEKKVIVVANLAPAKIMGIESEGMILAGSDEKALEIPMLKNLPPGSKVS